MKGVPQLALVDALNTVQWTKVDHLVRIVNFLDSNTRLLKALISVLKMIMNINHMQEIYFDVMKQRFSISLFVSFPDGHQIYFTSGDQNPDYSFIMETKVLKDTEKERKKLENGTLKLIYLIQTQPLFCGCLFMLYSSNTGMMIGGVPKSDSHILRDFAFSHTCTHSEVFYLFDFFPLLYFFILLKQN